MADQIRPVRDEEVPESLGRTLLGQRLLEIRAATALRRGDHDDAARLAAWLGEPHRSLLAAKLHLSAGDTRAALVALRSVELVSTRHRLDGLLIRARCASAAGDRVALVREAVEVAEPDHYKRRFLEQRGWITSVLKCIAVGWPTPYASELVVALEEVGSERPQPGGVDDLTPREWEVLGHLGTRLSLPEIGTILYISPNTVKSHVRSIYRKLGVRNRLEADVWQRAKVMSRG
jgi:LuxR family maltose regulon positive regulatory protein